MFNSDFVLIKYFTALEIKCTGAKLGEVDYNLIHSLDRVRHMFDKPIHLCVNGLTSGEHQSELHRQSKAVDFYVKDISDTEIVKLCLIGASIGFTDFGVYDNGSGVYSFHFALGKELKTWVGSKTANTNWKYSGLRFKM